MDQVSPNKCLCLFHQRKVADVYKFHLEIVGATSFDKSRCSLNSCHCLLLSIGLLTNRLNQYLKNAKVKECVQNFEMYLMSASFLQNEVEKANQFRFLPTQWRLHLIFCLYPVGGTNTPVLRTPSSRRTSSPLARQYRHTSREACSQDD